MIKKVRGLFPTSQKKLSAPSILKNPFFYILKNVCHIFLRFDSMC